MMAGGGGGGYIAFIFAKNLANWSPTGEGVQPITEQVHDWRMIFTGQWCRASCWLTFLSEESYLCHTSLENLFPNL